jgi:hypothetical protein
MNVLTFLKREQTQWTDLWKQPLLQNKTVNTTADSKTRTILMGGAPIACYTVNLLDDRLAMTLPKEIRPIASQSRGMETRPDVTLADVNETVKITLTHLSQRVSSHDEVLDYKNQLQQALKKVNPSLEWLLGGVKEVRGVPIAFFEIITTVFGIGIYNLRFFLPLQHQVLSGSFMCVDQALKYWRPIFYEILESIEVKNAVGFHQRLAQMPTNLAKVLTTLLTVNKF